MMGKRKLFTIILLLTITLIPSATVFGAYSLPAGPGRAVKYQTAVEITFVIILACVLIIGMLFSRYLINRLQYTANKAARKLDEERTWLKTILSSIGDGVIATDTEGYVTFMNPVAEALTGYTEEESTGKPIEDILNIYDTDSGEKTEITYKDLITKDKPSTIKSFSLLISKNQDEHVILSTLSPICGNNNKIIGVVLVFQDISEKMQAEAIINHQAYYDSLTDLPNRKLFREHLFSAIENSRACNKKLAVMFIDLDYFKNVNDTLGHNIGDLLLQHVSKRLVQVLGDELLISRMGGDEFTILLPDITDADDVSKLALKVLDTLCVPFTINEHQLFVTASIGISIFPDDGYETEIILKHADAALYNAKEQGRNNYQVYSSTRDEISKQKFSLVKSLRTALEKNELVLHYQPKIDSFSNKIVGLETLVRWQHPDKGLIYPGAFIPIAEETGLIKLLDNWVLKNACSQFKSWVDSGYNPPRLAVNLSAYQFRHQNLVDTISAVLSETGLEPSYLEIEITETTAMENIDFTVKTLHRLIDMGINISIDDFGSGYSSLNYLKHFPVHLLKIDRSFISDIMESNNTRTIVKAIIEVAHSLNIRVTAEGVETPDQLRLLREMSCDEIQGYLISKPIPVQEIEKLMVADKR